MSPAGPPVDVAEVLACTWCRTPLFPSVEAEVGVVRNGCGDPTWVQVCCAYCWLDDAEAEDVEVYS